MQVDGRRYAEKQLAASAIEITNKLIKSVKAACQWYKLDREQQKKSVMQNESNQ